MVRDAWGDRPSTILDAATEFRGRPDLIELAMASNAKLAELQRQVMALNGARVTGSDVHRRIKTVLEQCVEEGRRFDAIEAAMDEAMLLRFWRQVGIPARA